MILAVRKKDHRVKMRSEEKIDVDTEKFELVEYEPTEDELKQIENNALMWFEKDKLILQEHPAQTKKKQDDEVQLKLKIIKEKMASHPSTPEIAEAIKDISQILESK